MCAEGVVRHISPRLTSAISLHTRSRGRWQTSISAETVSVWRRRLLRLGPSRLALIWHGWKLPNQKQASELHKRWCAVLGLNQSRLAKRLSLNLLSPHLAGPEDAGRATSCCGPRLGARCRTFWRQQSATSAAPRRYAASYSYRGSADGGSPVTVFVSYSSRDKDAVKSLTQDLQDADEQVWLDERLAGGDAWWRAILEQIRGCDVFIFALSQNSSNPSPARPSCITRKISGSRSFPSRSARSTACNSIPWQRCKQLTTAPQRRRWACGCFRRSIAHERSANHSLRAAPGTASTVRIPDMNRPGKSGDSRDILPG
jgi:hypothetical protein